MDPDQARTSSESQNLLGIAAAVAAVAVAAFVVAILIGKGGRMVREIGTAARTELERDLGAHVFLNLHVKVREHWRRDDALLDRIGIE